MLEAILPRCKRTGNNAWKPREREISAQQFRVLRLTKLTQLTWAALHKSVSVGLLSCGGIKFALKAQGQPASTHNQPR